MCRKQPVKYSAIINGILITPTKQIKDGVVVVKDEKIIEVGSRHSVTIPQDAALINAKGNFIAPGMIDIHVNGGMRADFTKPEESTFTVAGNFFAQHGVTSYLASIITSPDEIFLEALQYSRDYIKEGKYGGAELLGIHMEGPYLSFKQSGAHPEQYLSVPKPSHYKKFLTYNDVLIKMTLAPELEGAERLVKDLNKSGIVAAAGHTDGIYSKMRYAMDAGISHATHSFCNMSNFRRDNLKRVAGAAETLLYDDRVSGELIGDGWHLGEILMNLLIKVKGVDRVCFVTDAMPAAGLPDGKYFIGEVEAIVENGIARLPDNTAYAGSVTNMETCLKNGVKLLGLKVADAIMMCTLSPAKIIRVDNRKGSIEKGKDADLIILDKELRVLKTIARGHVIHTKE